MSLADAPGLSPARRRALLLLGMPLLAVIVWAQVRIVHGQIWNLATGLQCAAALVFAWLLGGSKAQPPGIASSRPLRRFEAALAAALVIAGVALHLWAVVVLTRSWLPRFDVMAPLAVAGVLLCSAGLWMVDRRRGRFHVTGTPIPWTETFAVAAIVALSLAFRFYRYDFFPPPDGISTIEEAQTGMWGLHILRGHRPWEFILDRWLAAAGITAGGASMTSLRVPFSIASALTVLPLYWLMRCLVHRWVAVLVAALFAVSHWHLIYARYGHNIFLTTLVVVFVFYLLARARIDGRLAPYPVVGFLSGLTLYQYAGYRGTLPLVVLFLALDLVRAWRARRRSYLPAEASASGRAMRHAALGLALTLAAAVALVPPLVVQVRANPNYSYFEAAQRSLLNEQYYSRDAAQFVAQRVRRLTETAEIFNHVGDRTFTMNAGGEPMLDPYVGALFVLAFAYALLNARQRDIGYFLFVFLFLLLGGAVFVQNLDVRRLQCVIPFLYLLLAFVLDRARVVATAFGGAGRAAGAVLAVALFAASAQSNYRFFFHRFIYDGVVRNSFKNAYTIGITHLHSLPPNGFQIQVSNITNFFEPSDYEWWRGDEVPGVVTTDLLPLLQGTEERWRGLDVYVALLDPFDNPDVHALLAQAFPGTKCERLQDPDNPNVHLTSCHIGDPAPRAPLSAGLRARYFYRGRTEPFLERREPAIAFALTPDACRWPLTRTPCRAEWHGTWEAPSGAASTLSLRPRTRSEAHDLRVDGAPPPQDAPAGPYLLDATMQYGEIEDVGAELTWYDAVEKRRRLVLFGEAEE